MSARIFRRAGLQACGTIALTAIALHAQAPRPAFEVAAIKRNVSGNGFSGNRTLPGGRINMENQRLRQIIRSAYGSSDLEVVGGPGWLDVDRWDIVATAGANRADGDIWREMLKTLLMERFKLVAHVEQRERPIYGLVFARADKQLGPAIHPTVCPATGPCEGEGTTANTNGIATGTIIGKRRALSDIGRSLSPYAERRVLDRTGLDGRYDYELKWSEDASFYTAVQEQLGLKLESQRAPLDVVIVESVEHPVED
jgi:uncharacterized protein (TIGR03435 family)